MDKQIDKRQINPTDITVVIPSLNPDNRIIQLVKELVQIGYKEIIIVNDGSTGESINIFKMLQAFPQCIILNHPENLGKGRALRTAFKWFLENNVSQPCYPQGVITVDGDGQHLPKDIVACCEALLDTPDSVILGCRDFSGNGVPPKSYMGNNITSFVFRIGCGIRLSDTQTGLRAIPSKFLPFMLNVSGDRFEYETNMLLEMKRAGIQFKEVKIETVYMEGNSGTHFRAIRDSALIYTLILKFILSSCIASLIDESAFYLFVKLSDVMFHQYSILLCTIFARIISSFVNFNTNRKVVFNCNKSYKRTMIRYYCLCIPQALVSAGCVWLISYLVASRTPWIVTLLKIFVDTILFFISFRIQREWVFNEKNTE
ncbi:bifunctional glycosyltransferase family 2/GtrA family protein [Faecalicatena contorta]|uniref:bifunctional glycosyltransferase family 2/GtrA family protein n=1 Tax=Faecalicatena contorta TaxID=39482 RepID=UPI001F1BD8CA|nr:bifunctional glycosyltransferase family 2/GtrA family protein [Faecalicatena contorta]MCF2555211.1 bifunctional glycosyltransferase family 2/GtrA family protein [Faecalicatena contorta]